MKNINYNTAGTCARIIHFTKTDDGRITNVSFEGGCNGNLNGIGILVKGMHVKDVIEKLQGLPCGSRPTSCPDQLSKGLIAYLEQKQAVKA